MTIAEEIKKSKTILLRDLKHELRSVLTRYDIITSGFSGKIILNFNDGGVRNIEITNRYE